MTKKDDIILYQGKDGAIELREDLNAQTVWASQSDIAEIFDIDRTVVTKHIGSIFKDGELDKKVVCAIFAHTTQHWALSGKTQIKSVVHYNLDIILAVGYRAKSSVAIKFRQWATKTLKSHIVDGYTINPSRIEKHYKQFLKAVEDVKKLLPEDTGFEAGDTLELIKMFAGTWFSLDAYDTSSLPTTGASKKQVEFTAEELVQALVELKVNLIEKKETTHLFGEEKQIGSLAGIVGNVFQSVFGKDAYPTLEEKAAHLLYFIIKNHPFNDGNKRSWAFAFVWFLRKGWLLDITRLSPEALTALTLLIAESNPKEKERMVGLVLLVLGRSSTSSAP